MVLGLKLIKLVGHLLVHDVLVLVLGLVVAVVEQLRLVMIVFESMYLFICDDFFSP